MTKTVTSGWATPFVQQTVAYGFPIAESLPEVLKRLSLKRVAVVTTNSLAGPGGLAEQVKNVLGDRFHSVTSGIKPHTPRREVVRVAKALEGADGVVTIGGGSVTDTVKAARLCLANGVKDAADMDRFRTYSKNPGGPGDSTVGPTMPFIAIPTTLSAAEFTNGAGVTDERGPVKQVFVYPNLNAGTVILDPAMTLQTPPRLLFSTAMRAVDHAVEGWCSTNTNPLASAHSLYAARLLIPSLRKVFNAPDDMQARVDCQLGAWMSVLAAVAGVSAGASHGYGHALGGTGGMPHGETSCVMLPHVLRYNAVVNAAQQQVLAEAVGQPDTPLAEIIADLVKTLKLPGRLRDTNLSESKLDAVAEASLNDPLVAANPRPLKTLAEVKALLLQAW